MTEERKNDRKDNSRFEALNFREMMNRTCTGCDCSQMMSRMEKLDDADDKGWAEMMKMCCSVQQEDEEAKGRINPI